MTQGTLAPTGNDLDVAIRGEGFFKIQLPDGTYAYTRDGSFQMDAQGRIVTRAGQRGAARASPSRRTRQRSPSTRRARSRRSFAGSTTPTVLGQLTLTRFVNKAGLQPIGDNLFIETPASGAPQDGTAQHRRLRRPAAGQSRTGQCRGRHRDLRPDRRAARLRDERQGHHRGRPDACITSNMMR